MPHQDYPLGLKNPARIENLLELVGQRQASRYRTVIRVDAVIVIDGQGLEDLILDFDHLALIHGSVYTFEGSTAQLISIKGNIIPPGSRFTLQIEDDGVVRYGVPIDWGTIQFPLFPL